jgi:hypothetical protein
MLSRFFSKSQPFVFVVLAFYLLVGFILAFIYSSSSEISFLQISQKTGVYLLLVFILLLINFICKRNKIDQQNAFSVMFFSALALNYPQSLIKFDSIFVVILTLLFIRRLLNLKNNVRHKKKIFEASFFLFFIILINPALTPLIIVLYAGIATYSYDDAKNFLVPFVAFLSTYMLCQIYSQLFVDEWFFFSEKFSSINYTFSFYDTTRMITAFSITCVFSLYMIIMVLKDMSQTNIQRKLMLRIISFSGIILLASALFLSNHNGDVLLVYHAVIALQAGNILRSKKKWINETVVLFFILSGSITWFSGLLNF